ncbi:hypothetical protein D7Z54_20610 [Salibacterium salarium]|uniref:Uncharacterized protein n=1 Tax=Salibacterium salarium TaxID=284579 RepID=A0A428MZ88_9BACI|nr:hypothetical protein [Salibacterium salarium]RSL31445.1 hypothetical protein D7Z54_20610 [Salibacterium salarium]
MSQQLTKAQAFKELYELLLYYSENRDKPVSGEFDFFENVKHYCSIIGMDYEEFIEEFNLKNEFL